MSNIKKWDGPFILSGIFILYVWNQVLCHCYRRVGICIGSITSTTFDMVSVVYSYIFEDVMCFTDCYVGASCYYCYWYTYYVSDCVACIGLIVMAVCGAVCLWWVSMRRVVVVVHRTVADVVGWRRWLTDWETCILEMACNIVLHRAEAVV